MARSGCETLVCMTLWRDWEILAWKWQAMFRHGAAKSVPATMSPPQLPRCRTLWLAAVSNPARPFQSLPPSQQPEHRAQTQSGTSAISVQGPPLCFLYLVDPRQSRGLSQPQLHHISWDKLSNTKGRRTVSYVKELRLSKITSVEESNFGDGV